MYKRLRRVKNNKRKWRDRCLEMKKACGDLRTTICLLQRKFCLSVAGAQKVIKELEKCEA